VRVKEYVVTRKGVTRLVCFIEHLDTRPWVILASGYYIFEDKLSISTHARKWSHEHSEREFVPLGNNFWIVCANAVGYFHTNRGDV